MNAQSHAPSSQPPQDPPELVDGGTGIDDAPAFDRTHDNLYSVEFANGAQVTLVGKFTFWATTDIHADSEFQFVGGQIEADTSHVKLQAAKAKRLGQRVRVTGSIYYREGVETGLHLTLLIEKITPVR